MDNALIVSFKSCLRDEWLDEPELYEPGGPPGAGGILADRLQ